MNKHSVLGAVVPCTISGVGKPWHARGFLMAHGSYFTHAKSYTISVRGALVSSNCLHCTRSAVLKLVKHAIHEIISMRYFLAVRAKKIGSRQASSWSSHEHKQCRINKDVRQRLYADFTVNCKKNEYLTCWDSLPKKYSCLKKMAIALLSAFGST